MRKMVFVFFIMFLVFGISPCYGDYLLDLEHIRQVDPADGLGTWIYEWDEETQQNLIVGSNTKICGPVSLLIAAAYINDFSLSNQKIKDLVDWMVVDGVYTSTNNYDGEYTNGDKIAGIAKDYYDYKKSTWYGTTAKTFNEGVSLIEESLKNNVPIVIGTYIKMNAPSGGHFMVADGLKDVNGDGDFLDEIDEIHVTDPATNDTEVNQKWYTINQFRNAYQGVLILDPYIGHYADGFHTDGTSQAFLDAYNRYPTDIGWPHNNGGDVFVHKWESNQDSNYRIWLQDFIDEDENNTALVLNEYLHENKAYLLKGAIRDFYMNNDGPFNYGMPFTDEITRAYADGPYNTVNIIQLLAIAFLQKYAIVFIYDNK